ncbi:MAG: carboxypeptidase-like regulatory domain-containing protein [Bryobacteraceae bacterium]
MALLSAASLCAQNTASIQGVVAGEDGKPVAGAHVIAIRAMPPYSTSEKTAQDGAFALSRLPDGAFKLCVYVRDANYLDPCQWSTTQTQVSVSPGQVSSGNRVVLKRASKLRIRIQDPERHLAQLSSSDPDAPRILMGVLTPGAISALVQTSTDQSGRNYEASVPFDTPLTFYVSPKRLDVRDDKGAAIQSNVRVNFQHNTGAAAQPAHTFVVAGRGN